MMGQIKSWLQDKGVLPKPRMPVPDGGLIVGYDLSLRRIVFDRLDGGMAVHLDFEKWKHDSDCMKLKARIEQACGVMSMVRDESGEG